MRDFLEKIDPFVVEEEFSSLYEIPAMARKTDETILFKNVLDFDMPVAINVVGSRRNIAIDIGCDVNEIPYKIQEGIDSPGKTVSKGSLTARKPDLNEIPVLKHFKEDAGRYITSGVVIAEDSDGRRNASIHRMLVKDRDRLGIRIVERHLHEIYSDAEKRGEKLPVAVVIGLDPSVLLGICTRVPGGFDELRLSSALKGQPIELNQCDTIDLEVPDAEVVLEGYLLPEEREPEGPFVDITGTYDGVRQQPVIELTGMHLKENPVYHGLLPAGSEHKLLMGMPYEPLIIKEVDKHCKAVNAILTEGGSCYLHGVVQINKTNPSDGAKAIKAAMKAHKSMKHCIVVDDDIDIYSPTDLEYAIATRVKGDEDIYIYPEVRGSTLDPRGKPDGTVCKTGVDATKKLGEEKKFTRAKVPKEDSEKITKTIKGLKKCS
ncbi:3-polyprenyl-4-hydroxybenzoate decarboxylase UbiD [Methanonatronarchaeum thermophilum]|uniref:Anhydromevalonate phosphate decarboxylase n=1 Tax=Methanonatronarchaeum thermophilum TaxID=1927129 RepID=A0A1Y3GEP8_9EURY|nr:UbiD family decarboxylase [Methanonatronarchaeum thermophilum]OUJ18664.1 3-polyprenyl-4-hydroxybenzoate decarboxylase UbiD [Methanonatronarchaeum thermophilum]